MKQFEQLCRQQEALGREHGVDARFTFNIDQMALIVNGYYDKSLVDKVLQDMPVYQMRVANINQDHIIIDNTGSDTLENVEITGSRLKSCEIKGTWKIIHLPTVAKYTIEETRKLVTRLSILPDITIDQVEKIIVNTMGIHDEMHEITYEELEIEEIGYSDIEILVNKLTRVKSLRLEGSFNSHVDLREMTTLTHLTLEETIAGFDTRMTLSLPPSVNSVCLIEFGEDSEINIVSDNEELFIESFNENMFNGDFDMMDDDFQYTYYG